MKYDLFNPTRATRIIFNGPPMYREIRVAPGQEVIGIELDPTIAATLLKTNGAGDLTIEAHDPDRPRPAPPSKSQLVLDGRYGIGDAIHQRGVLRELMRDHEVWLQTCHFRVYEDLVERGLHLIFKPCHLHAQAKTIRREQTLFPHSEAPHKSAKPINLSYNKELIDKHGSILEAMAGCCGVKIRPLDFSLPVRQEWVDAFRSRCSWNTGGKPIMVYRPIVQRREWNGANRNPDPESYRAIFRAVRDGFFVVSLADLAPEVEWIVGPEESTDLKLHHGELTFEDMTALWSSAAMVFCNAGFAPVLAQAVGTPSITVYGGRECYRTTQRAGAHLAPTLGIDPDQPCDCMSERHDCGSKHITLEPAIARARAFVEQTQQTQRRSPQGVGDEKADGGGATSRGAGSTLIFATTYVDSADRERLTRQWLDLHTAINPECDILLIDSASPKPVLDATWAARFAADPRKYRLLNLGDNIGHLSRQGRDGWGRAFCRGLDEAVERGYAHVVHIEGDSLCRVPARDLVAKLKASGKGAASIPVNGTGRTFPNWVETGLIAFSTDYLKRSGFVREYNWPVREVRPTPELVVKQILGSDLTLLGIKGLRGDKNEITHQNIVSLNLDWVTHTHSDILCYQKFVEANLPPAGCTKFTNIGPNQEHQGNVSLLLPCSPIAVVVGGARGVWEEIGQTAALAAGIKMRFFVINDMIPLFPGPCTAVSLHPLKLKGWLEARDKAGWLKPYEVWAHVKHADATHFTDDWRGSSGLFAIKVALQLGFTRIVLCGVPMEAKAGHVTRGPEPWRAGEQFMGGWKMHKDEIAPHVRSWSGWTAETFGRPDAAFIGVRA